MSLYCTNLFTDEAAGTMACTQPTPAFFAVFDADGNLIDDGLCAGCASFLCPAEGKVEEET